MTAPDTARGERRMHAGRHVPAPGEMREDTAGTAVRRVPALVRTPARQPARRAPVPAAAEPAVPEPPAVVPPAAEEKPKTPKVQTAGTRYRRGRMALGQLTRLFTDHPDEMIGYHPDLVKDDIEEWEKFMDLVRAAIRSQQAALRPGRGEEKCP